MTTVHAARLSFDFDIEKALCIDPDVLGDAALCRELKLVGLVAFEGLYTSSSTFDPLSA